MTTPLVSPADCFCSEACFRVFAVWSDPSFRNTPKENVPNVVAVYGVGHRVRRETPHDSKLVPAPVTIQWLAGQTLPPVIEKWLAGEIKHGDITLLIEQLDLDKTTVLRTWEYTNHWIQEFDEGQFVAESAKRRTCTLTFGANDLKASPA